MWIEPAATLRRTQPLLDELTSPANLAARPVRCSPPKLAWSPSMLKPNERRASDGQSRGHPFCCQLGELRRHRLVVRILNQSHSSRIKRIQTQRKLMDRTCDDKLKIQCEPFFNTHMLLKSFESKHFFRMICIKHLCLLDKLYQDVLFECLY